MTTFATRGAVRPGQRPKGVVERCDIPVARVVTTRAVLARNLGFELRPVGVCMTAFTARLFDAPNRAQARLVPVASVARSRGVRALERKAELGVERCRHQRRREPSLAVAHAAVAVFRHRSTVKIYVAISAGLMLDVAKPRRQRLRQRVTPFALHGAVLAAQRKLRQGVQSPAERRR